MLDAPTKTALPVLPKRPVTIDDAVTALAVARGRRDELVACEALVAAAQARAQQLRTTFSNATRSSQ